LVSRATSSTEAHDLYLRGRYFWNKRTADDLKRASGLFRQALEVDPGFALAHAGLGDSYALLAEYTPARPDEVLPQAAEHARKALALDPALAEPHATLGLLAMAGYDWPCAGRWTSTRHPRWCTGFWLARTSEPEETGRRSQRSPGCRTPTSSMPRCAHGSCGQPASARPGGGWRESWWSAPEKRRSGRA